MCIICTHNRQRQANTIITAAAPDKWKYTKNYKSNKQNTTAQNTTLIFHSSFKFQATNLKQEKFKKPKFKPAQVQDVKWTKTRISHASV